MAEPPLTTKELRMFRATGGELPEDDARELAGISLPPGHIVNAEQGSGPPVAWISAEQLPEDALTERVRALAAMFPQTGLWPMQALGLDNTLDQPWGAGEMDGPDGEIPDALATLLAVDHFDEPTVPAVTALAPAQPGPDLRPDELDIRGAGGLLLVPVGRPADVPAALGWWGGTNYAMSGTDFSAVLRSWEDRFGAVLVSIGFDTMTVQVGRRPMSEEQTDALLREHYAFCPDNIDQGMQPDAFRTGLPDWAYWNFWWD
ncbi:DUF4253 domain-containing protein [Mycolicibacterium goodii]|uniref:DUF4253 domain-containing protein n=1 Tax=Mycolicibacterium goodii TaxID=134601 RepID=A0ABS6HYK3_MYCGD|nr:DUF4253 domain-containing protein [Mycolicibacterium goodii]MBU8814339.1 DUF4253 domain-containing protein [Mycolicibacterium goodii]MBU8827743.1 DUF4253 domain-containing protein [Mycolicibacterium goodii]MBU8840763.1 DUF4253 domain-containing protein [Mycolicibacterium goodii]